METVQLELSPRQVTGKKVRALRGQGITPVHLYGKGIASMALQTNTKTLQRVLSHVGKNVPVNIVVEGAVGQNISFVREVQLHPVTEDLLHVDFYRVDITERITAEVPVLLVGEAPAARVERGMLIQAMHNLTVECLPMDMPGSIQIDISILDNFEKAIRVANISLPSEVTILNAPDDMIVRVNPPRVEEEVEEAVAGVEAGAPEKEPTVEPEG